MCIGWWVIDALLCLLLACLLDGNVAGFHHVRSSMLVYFCIDVGSASPCSHVMLTFWSTVLGLRQAAVASRSPKAAVVVGCGGYFRCNSGVL